MPPTDSLLDAYRRALEADPVAAFGAVLAVNRVVDAATAEELVLSAYEAVVAPGFSDEALAGARGAARADAAGGGRPPRARRPTSSRPVQRIDGGAAGPDPRPGAIATSAAQRRHPAAADARRADRPAVRVACGAARDQQRGRARDATARWWAWARDRRAGSRRSRSRSTGHPTGRRCAALASDAYFPFADAIALAGERGVTAIIQPGGSVRDEMAIEVADRHHMAMVFTGRRHFRH